MNEFDVVVIGAGPGGYACAIKASQLGLKSAIAEKEWLGGVCLNIGCIPSKALIKNAELAHTLRERSAEFGISYDNLKLDYSAAFKRSRQVSERLTRGVAFLLKKNQVDVFMGAAKLESKNQVAIVKADGGKETLQTRNIVIASGSHSFVPAGWPVDGKRVITYREAILQQELPKSAVIIGAGAMGVEFASVWSSYGVKVSLVEMLPSILPLEDQEVSQELNKAFTKRGVKIYTEHKVEAISADEGGVKVAISGSGSQSAIEAEQVLVAIGFRPNTAELGLEETGVELDGKNNQAFRI